MKIVVVTRCLNGQEYIDRFVRGYEWADEIIVSDGGSTDDSLEMFKTFPDKVSVVNYENVTFIGGYKWNPDNYHIQHAIDEGLKRDPDWIILDDLDDVPNKILRMFAREILEHADKPQVNAFRLYLWGEKRYFPAMNGNFNPAFKSLWAWKPKELTIETDKSVAHGTLSGVLDDYAEIDIPLCLLHKSWHPRTIGEKIKRYNAIGLPMMHPRKFAGKPECLPEWAHE